MKKFFLALLLAASAACMAAQVAFADDSGFIAGGGSAGSGSGVGRDDIATSETASGVGRDDVLAFGSDMKDSVDKYGPPDVPYMKLMRFQSSLIQGVEIMERATL